MKRALSLALLGAAVALACFAEGTPAQDKQTTKKKRVLLITEAKGAAPDVLKRPKKGGLCPVEEAFVALSNKSDLFDVACSQSLREAITPENLKAYDAVWFFTAGSPALPDKQKAALLAFVKSGKGFGGCANAADTFDDWPEYGQLIGARVDGTLPVGMAAVVVEDTKHPATKHLGPKFDIAGDIYQFKAPYSRKDLHVLMKLDAPKLTVKGKRTDDDYALAWTHDFGKGRVFYTALGQSAQAWKDSVAQQHILGGVQYILFADGAAGKTGGGIKPAVEKD